ncbi:hypothetical protein CXG81DRAFT_27956 [Caulochytrium protostelioides]|uniref:C2H2-type domain-containing protein n=1 Tax=Caulochytrium protostelioides TaxID=1555241 RepID=A0A4P9X2X2_9FUNG|nr:hypothetical protein CXG81DRAFT_27956 [Caulochytrium protostelioides]|eukprot:RKO99276.1 hypothetical protein CXG81DRAFT_27956 [Caulochytrium protostelioides]
MSGQDDRAVYSRGDYYQGSGYGYASQYGDVYKRGRSPSPDDGHDRVTKMPRHATLPASGDYYAPSYHTANDGIVNYRGTGVSGGPGSAGIAHRGGSYYTPAGTSGRSAASGAAAASSDLKDPTGMDCVVSYAYFEAWYRQHTRALGGAGNNRGVKEIQERYDKYKLNAETRQYGLFFGLKKDVAWFRERYHPKVTDLRADVEAMKQRALTAFMARLDQGDLDGVSFEAAVPPAPAPTTAAAPAAEPMATDASPDADADTKPVTDASKDGDAADAATPGDAQRTVETKPVAEATMADAADKDADVDDAATDATATNGDATGDAAGAPAAATPVPATPAADAAKTPALIDVVETKSTSVVKPGILDVAPTTAFIASLPEDVPRAALVDAVKAAPGFAYVALADPRPDREYGRYGWIVCEPGTPIADVISAVDNQAVAGASTLHVTEHTYAKPKLRVLPTAFSYWPRLIHDARQALEVAQHLDASLIRQEEAPVADGDAAAADAAAPADGAAAAANGDAAPADGDAPADAAVAATTDKAIKPATGCQLVLERLSAEFVGLAVETACHMVEAAHGDAVATVAATGCAPEAAAAQASEDVQRAQNLILRALDLLILYLRCVHFYDYYSGTMTQSLEDLLRRTTIMTRRAPFPLGAKPPPAPSSSRAAAAAATAAAPSSSEAEASEASAAALAATIDKRVKLLMDTLSPEELTKLGVKDFGSEYERLVEDRIQQMAGEKYRCRLCSKPFKAPEFVKKHLGLKHPEMRADLQEQVTFYNNFVRDASKVAMSAAFAPSPALQTLFAQVQARAEQAAAAAVAASRDRDGAGAGKDGRNANGTRAHRADSGDRRGRGYDGSMPPRARREPPPPRDARMDPRSLRSYQDLDSMPAGGDMDISYD